MYSAAPVLPAALITLKTAFDAAIIDALQGGTPLTAAKNVVRDQVIDALNKDASYVDITANGDLAMLLLSGYQSVSTNRAQFLLHLLGLFALGERGEGAARQSLALPNDAPT